MANCEETDFQGSHAVLGKRKRKKNSRKDHQEDDTWKKDDVWKKKKKKGSKCKDTPGTKKEKKKDKKKKKRKISMGPGSDLVFADPAQADPAALYRTQSQCQDQEPKPKRKKKVAFDLSPGNIRAKRPQFASSAAAFENKTPGDTARLTQDNNSPCNSEDVNSQDLFITQKTFRAPSPEPCSGDTIAAAPTQMLHPLKESCSQVKARLRGNPSEYKFVHARPRVDHFPAEAAVVNAPGSWTCQKISTSTQTENFFTIELSSYLRFTHAVEACSVDLDPLDLSLPQRARKDPGKSLLGDRIEGTGSKSPGVESRGSFQTKGVKKEPSAGCAAETNPRCCSESGCKSADSTASSGEEPPSRTKLDLTQVRAVQTRLNESFFFKTKGDGQSPRPESPLMKLIQGRDGKSRK